MARRKTSENNIRKLTRVGLTSLCVTIPIEFITYLKWRHGQKVIVKKQGKKLIIQDWHGINLRNGKRSKGTNKGQ